VLVLLILFRGLTVALDFILVPIARVVKVAGCTLTLLQFKHLVRNVEHVESIRRGMLLYLRQSILLQLPYRFIRDLGWLLRLSFQGVGLLKQRALLATFELLLGKCYDVGCS
jgi:hypothetical protein